MFRKLYDTARKSRLVRMTCLLTALTLVICIFIRQFQYNMANAYAVTYSFGHGYGIVIYSPKYHELPPILQESVRVHEDRHLDQGSYAFWRHNDLEVDAYQFQIQKIDERIGQLWEVYRKTGDFNARCDIELLRNFRQDMLHHMRVYQGLEKDEGD